MKEALYTEPDSVTHDFDKPFLLYSDTSNIGLEAVVIQTKNGKFL